ncbi:MAG TPA: glycoside hydrolase family 2 TIM barrel-domain containing protein [Thermoanaerobaculia bacterium]|jgi:hypothetical protein
MNTPDRHLLDRGWKAIRAGDTPLDGSAISDPATPLTGWLDAVVPGTVLTTLCSALPQEFPDPYYGIPSPAIPDASSAGVDRYTFWFAAAVELPALGPGQQAWIRFRGINESAEVFFNGRRLNAATLRGMFLRHAFNVTPLARPGAANRVAVRVTPPDPPGVPGGNGGGPPNIANSVTMRYGVGWDWVIPMPDRSAGIWDEVAVEITGSVTIADPHVVTTVLGSDGTLLGQASVAVSAEVANAASEPVAGELACDFNGGTARVELSLAPGETRTIAFPPLTVDAPRLWWPNGYGEQPLYPLTITASAGGTVSHVATLDVGIRQIGVDVIDVGGMSSRAFRVNGRRIFLRGGNWIGTDAMLRLSARRYDDEVRLHAMTGLNFIRVWGGGIAERPEFYDACDRYGMLVMQDFWISGEYDSGYPPDYGAIFLACAADTIRLLRNHPSLLFWCGGNEALPPEPIAKQLQCFVEGGEACTALDGTRPYIDMSTNIAGSVSSQYLDGPYGILDPETFFGGRGTGPLRDTPFNPELGSVGTPVVESVLAMMPAEAANDFPTPEAWNDTWKYHTYIPYSSGGLTRPDQVLTYGTPATLAGFCQRAQLANYLQYKALVEGYTMQMWTQATGFVIWKTQNPWPGLRGSLYDWYLDQNGGYYGVRQATEPVHAQIDLATGEIVIVNVSADDLENVEFSATAYDLEGRAGTPVRGTLARAPSMSVTRTGASAPSPAGAPAWFVQLTIGGRPSNFSWLHRSDGDYTSLATMPTASIETSATARLSNGRTFARVRIANTTSPVAFFLRLQVLEQTGGTRILPVFYSDNYFSLVSGETREIDLDFAGEGGDLYVEGWNVPRQRIRVTAEG